MERKSHVYDLKDLQEEVRLGPATLRKLIKSGRLRGRKIGRGYYVTEASLNSFLNNNTSGSYEDKEKRG